MKRGRLIPLEEVEVILGVSEETLLGWIKDGKISSVKTPEGTVCIEEDELVRFIEKSKGEI